MQPPPDFEIIKLIMKCNEKRHTTVLGGSDINTLKRARVLAACDATNTFMRLANRLGLIQRDNRVSLCMYGMRNGRRTPL